MKGYPRGSEWRRWDLHIHSPLSILHNNFPHLDNGEPDWDVYTRRLEQSGVAVVGVTDYFTIDGYKVLKSRQERGQLGDTLLLPNIEFRLDKLIQPRRGDHPARRLDFHVIFSDDVEPQDIEDHFLHDLNFVYEQDPYDGSQKYRLKASNLEVLGNRLKEDHAAFTGSALQVGAKTAVVSLDEILTVLRANERFRERYLLVLPTEGWDQISWDGQDHLTRKTLLQAAHMVFSSNPQTMNWCLGTDPYTEGPATFVREFGGLKPCIHGSDAHSLSEIARPCARRGISAHSCEEQPTDCDLRHCWIKADPTFEGLKQLLYEPSDRVSIQTAVPAPLKSNYAIAHINIPTTRINAELSFRSLDLDLNDGLVVVTGGRGSGKTAFVDLIANAYMDRRNSDDRNSFVRRISGDSSQLAVQLVYKNGEVFEKQVEDASFFDESEIVYIAQGELERYVGNTSNLNDYINNLIFDSSPVKNSLAAFEYGAITDAVHRMEGEIQTLNVEIEELERRTAMDREEAIRKQGRRASAELKDVEARIKEYEESVSIERQKVVTERQRTLTKLGKRKEKLLELSKTVGEATTLISEYIDALTPRVDRINRLVAELEIYDGKWSEPVYEGVEALRTLEQLIGQKLRDVVKQMEVAEEGLRTLEIGMREHARALAKREELNGMVQSLRRKWTDLQESRKHLGGRREFRDGKFEELVENILAEREKYRDVNNAVRRGKESSTGRTSVCYGGRF